MLRGAGGGWVGGVGVCGRGVSPFIYMILFERNPAELARQV